MEINVVTFAALIQTVVTTQTPVVWGFPVVGTTPLAVWSSLLSYVTF